MRLGVVILNYKSYDVTLDCLSKLERLEQLDDIVVVDNNSPNASYQRLQAAQPGHRWHLLQSGENRGYSAGNNVGIRYLMEHTGDDIIGIVNPDVCFDGEFLRQIRGAFAAHDEYAVLTGVQHRRDGSVSNRSFWPELTRWTTIRSNLWFLNKLANRQTEYNMRFVRETLSQAAGQDLVEVPVVEGCCFFMRRCAWEQIGLLDERMFLFFEEDILAYRVHRKGWKIGVLPQTAFLHDHSTTLKSIYSSLQTDLLLLKSRGKFYRHYLSRGFLDDLAYALSVAVFYLEKCALVPYHWLRGK